MADENNPKNIVPIPDPTLLTTAQLYREIAALDASILARLLAVREEIRALREIMDSKYEAITIKFVERDIRFGQRDELNKSATEAQLVAHTTAINKAEAGFSKQIDEIGKRIEILTRSIEERVTGITKSLDERVSDLKDRMTTIETRAATTSMVTRENKQEKADSSQMNYYAISGIVGLVGILFGFGMLVLNILRFK